MRITVLRRTQRKQGEGGGLNEKEQHKQAWKKERNRTREEEGKEKALEGSQKERKKERKKEKLKRLNKWQVEKLPKKGEETISMISATDTQRRGVKLGLRSQVLIDYEIRMIAIFFERGLYKQSTNVHQRKHNNYIGEECEQLKAKQDNSRKKSSDTSRDSKQR